MDSKLVRWAKVALAILIPWSVGVIWLAYSDPTKYEQPPVIGIPRCELGHTISIRDGVQVSDKVEVICQGSDGRWVRGSR